MVHKITRLTPEDAPELRALNALYADVFDDADTHLSNPLSTEAARARLSDPNVIALIATAHDEIIGGLTAYILPKLEQDRSELYIYDLAVQPAHRRKGVASGLIEALQPIAKAANAWVIYVQADHSDPPAIALYERLGTREDVLHFDIPVRA